MTGQVAFDSHVTTIGDAVVALVNAVVPGEAHGRPYDAPTGARRRELLSRALVTMDGRRSPVDEPTAQQLAVLAPRLRVVFAAAEAGDLGRAATQVNLLLEETGARPRLDQGSSGTWGLHFHGPDVSVYAGWAAGLAAALALAVGSDLAGRLGVCSAPGCDRVYLDASRNAGRRFCSTRCQSRVKAAAHRARSAARPQ